MPALLKGLMKTTRKPWTLGNPRVRPAISRVKHVKRFQWIDGLMESDTGAWTWVMWSWWKAGNTQQRWDKKRWWNMMWTVRRWCVQRKRSKMCGCLCWEGQIDHVFFNPFVCHITNAFIYHFTALFPSWSWDNEGCIWENWKSQRQACRIALACDSSQDAPPQFPHMKLHSSKFPLSKFDTLYLPVNNLKS